MDTCKMFVLSNIMAALSFGACYFFPWTYTFPGYDAGFGSRRYKFGPAGCVFSCTFLWCMLFAGNFAVHSPRVFLDKICIHQRDAKLKAAGIKCLGAFLQHSTNLLVLYGND